MSAMSDTVTDSERRPPGPPSHWGLRTVVRFIRDQLGLLRTTAQTYGDLARITMLGRDFYLVSHPDDIEAVFVKHARIMRRDEYVTILERALGKGLLTSDGDLWKQQRKLMSQAFVPRRIQSYGAAMVRVTDAGITRWRDGAAINVHQEMSRLTMEVVADVLFGSGLSRADIELVGESMEIINEYTANSPEAIVKLPMWVPTPRHRRVARAMIGLDEIVFRIIADRRAGDARDDLLGTLLAAQGDDGARMSDKQLRDEVMTLFLAGHETTSLTLAHTLYLLGRHPAIEAKLYEELTRVLGDRLPTVDDVRALPYTERVIKESLRLYPPAWTTGREATEDVEVGGYRIPKGAQILLSQWVVHRDARWFPDPEVFDPDRWASERTQKLSRYAYFPFGGGPRVCIGNHFAMLEATLMLAIIVGRWHVELSPGQHLTFKPSVTLRQAGPGLKARLVKRRRESVAAE